MDGTSTCRCPGCGRNLEPWRGPGLTGGSCRTCASLVCTSTEFLAWAGAGALGEATGTSEAECRGCESTLELIPAGEGHIERCPDCGLVAIAFHQARAVAGVEVPLPEPLPHQGDDESDVETPVPGPKLSSEPRLEFDEPDDGEDDSEFGDLAWTGVSAFLGTITFGLWAVFSRRL